MFSQRAVIAFLVLCTIIGVVYYIFIYDPLPPNVEMVIPITEQPTWWQLSPHGDKIVYTSKGVTMLLSLKTYQKQALEKYKCFWWVNDTILHCQTATNLLSVLVNSDNLNPIPLQEIQKDNSKLPTILQQAGKIYRYNKGDLKLNFFYALSQDKNKPDENYQINIDSEDIDAVLKGYTYTLVSFLPFETSKPLKVASPNQTYYMIWLGRQVTVYDIKTNQQLAQYVSPDNVDVEVGGWAWDSSGVYFKHRPPIALVYFGPSVFPILKLVIPKQN